MDENFTKNFTNFLEVKDKNENFASWQRNVIDEFKEKSEDEIKKILSDQSFPYAVCMQNIIGDFNIGTIIRNSNAFNSRELFYFGKHKFDKRGAVGTYKYKDVIWLESFEDLSSLSSKYNFIGVDNGVEGAVDFSRFNWSFNKPPMIIFGEEQIGLSPEVKKLCNHIVYIKQYGSVRSLNVGTASGIILNHVVQEYNKNRFVKNQSVFVTQYDGSIKKATFMSDSVKSICCVMYEDNSSELVACERIFL